MKHLTFCAACVLVLACLVFSCSKSNNATPPITVPPPTTPTMTINLANPATWSREVIISETGGKILLDTVPPNNSTLVATLKTAQTLLDFTLIGYDSVNANYTLTTYKGVNPSLWTSLYATLFGSPDVPTSWVPASVYYKNAPSVSTSNFLLDDNLGAYNPSITSQGPGYLDMSYWKHGSGSYLYLLFPGSGLYNFHVTQGLSDTVDLSHMDTAVMLNFQKPAQYTLEFPLLYGIMDTTDFSKSVVLFLSPTPSSPDVEYPKKLVQKLEFSVGANAPNNVFSTYYSYSDTLASTLPFPDETYYTISSSQAGNFSVKFNSTESYYYTRWQNAKIIWQLFASPDSTNLNPQQLLNSLSGAKMLQGQSLSGLTMYGLGFENADGLNYAGYVSYVCNPALVKTRRVARTISYSKGF